MFRSNQSNGEKNKKKIAQIKKCKKKIKINKSKKKLGKKKKKIIQKGHFFLNTRMLKILDVFSSFFKNSEKVKEKKSAKFTKNKSQ